MKKKSISKSRRRTKKSISKSRTRRTKKSISRTRTKKSDGMDGIPQISESIPGGDPRAAQEFENTLEILNALDFTNKMTIENFTTIINDVYSNGKYLFIIDHNSVGHDEDNEVNDFYKVHKDLEPTFYCFIEGFTVTFKLENHIDITNRYSRRFKFASYNLLENGNHVIKRIVEESGPPAGAISDDDEEM